MYKIFVIVILVIILSLLIRFSYKDKYIYCQNDTTILKIVLSIWIARCKMNGYV